METFLPEHRAVEPPVNRGYRLAVRDRSLTAIYMLHSQGIVLAFSDTNAKNVFRTALELLFLGFYAEPIIYWCPL